jgi:hypothetical protein
MQQTPTKASISVEGAGTVLLTTKGISLMRTNDTDPDTMYMLVSENSRGDMISVKIRSREGKSRTNGDTVIVSQPGGSFLSGLFGNRFSFNGGVTVIGNSSVIINGRRVTGNVDPSDNDESKRVTSHDFRSVPVCLRRLDCKLSSTVVLHEAEALMTPSNSISFTLTTSSDVIVEPDGSSEDGFKVDAPVRIDCSTSADFRSMRKCTFADIDVHASTSADVTDISIDGVANIVASTSADVRGTMSATSRVSKSSSTSADIHIRRW